MTCKSCIACCEMVARYRDGKTLCESRGFSQLSRRSYFCEDYRDYEFCPDFALD